MRRIGCWRVVGYTDITILPDEISGLPVICPEQGPSFFGVNPAQNQEGPALKGALIAPLCEHTEETRPAKVAPRSVTITEE